MEKTPPNALGKLPPQAPDLEEVIIGSILITKDGAYFGLKLMAEEHFYLEKHRLVFAACKAIQNRSEPVDIMTVTAQLRTDGNLERIGGALAISQFTDRVASTANIEFHCRIVLQKYLSRELIRISSETIRDAYNGSQDIFSVLDQTIARLHDSTKGVLGSADKSLGSLLSQLVEQAKRNLDGIPAGVTTGNPGYDKHGGQQNGTMIVLAGRPGMGKTARMVNEAYFQIAELDLAVVIHSLEMTAIEIMSRLIGLHMGIEPAIILKRKIEDWGAFEDAVKWFSTKKLSIFTSTKLTNIQIESHIAQATIGCDIVYIDYIQLIKTGDKNTFDEISNASREVKQLAKSLDVPVVALAQLSRAVEMRGGDKKPILSDLKGSGQLEQDADVVEFLYRPEYYGILQDEDGFDTTGKIYYLNRKNRSGEPGLDTVLNWDGPLNKISTINSFEETKKLIKPNEDFDNFKSITMQSHYDKDDSPF